MQSDTIEVVSLVSWTTIDAALCVVVAGLASGFVALGVVQIYARERIQRRVLDSFFGLYQPGGVKFAASFLQMPERVLCRLYYRQIAGQFLAAVNVARTGGLEAKAPTPVQAFLRRFLAAADSRGRKSGSIEEAVRQIDVLQADLGDAVLRAVMKIMIASWWFIYIALGMLAGFQVLRELAATSGIAERSGEWAGYLGGVTIIAIVGGAILALGSAASGLVAFIWLDRITAAK
jgi:hypothetical protein